MASPNASGVVEKGNVVVYLYERADDPFFGVHACPMSSIVPAADGAFVSEKTVRTVKINGQDYPCLVLSVDYEKELPHLLMEAQYERNRQYKDMGQRWTTELKLRPARAIPSSIIPSAASSQSSTTTSGGRMHTEIVIDSEPEGDSYPRTASRTLHEASPEIFDRVQRTQSRATPRPISRTSRSQAANVSPVRVKEERISPLLLPGPSGFPVSTPVAAAAPTTSSKLMKRKRGRPSSTVPTTIHSASSGPAKKLKRGRPFKNRTPLKVPTSATKSPTPVGLLARKQVTRIPRPSKSPKKSLADLPVARTREQAPSSNTIRVTKTIGKSDKTVDLYFNIPKTFHCSSGTSVDSDLLFEAMLNQTDWRKAMRFAILKIFSHEEIRTCTPKGANHHYRSKGRLAFDKEKLDGLLGLTARYGNTKEYEVPLDYLMLINQLNAVKNHVTRSLSKKET